MASYGPHILVYGHPTLLSRAKLPIDMCTHTLGQVISCRIKCSLKPIDVRLSLLCTQFGLLATDGCTIKTVMIRSRQSNGCMILCLFWRCQLAELNRRWISARDRLSQDGWPSTQMIQLIMMRGWEVRVVWPNLTSLFWVPRVNPSRGLWSFYCWALGSPWGGDLRPAPRMFTCDYGGRLHGVGRPMGFA